MFKNLVPMTIALSKFTGRVAGTTLIAMGTVKGTEYVAERFSKWNEERKQKKADRESGPRSAAA